MLERSKRCDSLPLIAALFSIEALSGLIARVGTLSRWSVPLRTLNAVVIVSIGFRDNAELLPYCGHCMLSSSHASTSHSSNSAALNFSTLKDALAPILDIYF